MGWLTFQASISRHRKGEYQAKQPAGTCPTCRDPHAEHDEIVDEMGGVAGRTQQNPGGEYKCEDCHELRNAEHHPSRDGQAGGEAGTAWMIGIEFAGHRPDPDRCRPGSEAYADRLAYTVVG